MNKLPDWVESQMWKGTIVKNINDTYYLYTNRSRRVPGKKNPQPVQKCIGPITEEGLFINARIPYRNSGIRVYEHGFTCAVESLWKKYSPWLTCTEEEAFMYLKRTILERSPQSSVLLTMKGIGWNGKEKSASVTKGCIEKWSGRRFDEFEVLKTVYLIDLGEGMRIVSFVTDEQKELLESVGADLYGYNQKYVKKDNKAQQ